MRPLEQQECGRTTFGIFNILLFLSVLVAGVVVFVRLTPANPLSPAFLEQDPPEIAWIEEPAGIGSDPLTLKARVSDPGAGLDEILVRISQRNKPQELLKHQVREGDLHEQYIKVTLDPKALELREGNAELQVVAFDRTLWNNGTDLSKTVQVDFLKPRIEVITPQQNAVAGGSELVFYKVLGKSISAHGIDSGDNLYPGFPAVAWDASFKNYDRVFFAFFPLAPSFDEKSRQLKIVARDSIGNSAEAPFKYRVRQKRWSTFKAQLNDGTAAALRLKLLEYTQVASIPIKLSGNLITDLRTLISELAQSDEGKIDDILSTSDAKRWWSDSFGKPVNGNPINSAGDRRVITINNQEAVTSSAQGAHFPVSSKTTVMSAQAGRVVFTGALGLLGTTVIIDHGCGISTVYGHLSNSSVKLGDSVTKGYQIGHSGTSGFSTSEEVYFELRVQGIPVSANEWWDPSWTKDHIDNKISFVQRTLIGASAE